jgi:hypothetical protein
LRKQQIDISSSRISKSNDNDSREEENITSAIVNELFRFAQTDSYLYETVHRPLRNLYTQRLAADSYNRSEALEEVRSEYIIGCLLQQYKQFSAKNGYSIRQWVVNSLMRHTTAAAAATTIDDNSTSIADTINTKIITVLSEKILNWIETDVVRCIKDKDEQALLQSRFLHCC